MTLAKVMHSGAARDIGVEYDDLGKLVGKPGKCFSERFAQTVQRTFADIFPRPTSAGPRFDIAPHFAFAVLQGLVLENIVLREHARESQVIEILKGLAAMAIPPTT